MEVERFFKVMMPGFTHKLNLPETLCKNLTQQKMEVAILKTQLGTWRIRVCPNQETGLICFQNGWPDFVRHHELNVGDFVVFEHTRNFHFKAFVFDRSGCEKVFIINKVDTKGDPDSSDDDEPPKLKLKRKHLEINKGLNIKDPIQNRFFVLTMCPSYGRHRCNARIPRAFWKMNYINDKKCLVLIRDGGGKEWRVDLLVSKTDDRCRLGKGWGEFYANNKLKDGDKCVFKLRKDAVGGSKDVAVMDVCIYPV